jgi:hypothetical protein
VVHAAVLGLAVAGVVALWNDLAATWRIVTAFVDAMTTTASIAAAIAIAGALIAALFLPSRARTAAPADQPRRMDSPVLAGANVA